MVDWYIHLVNICLILRLQIYSDINLSKKSNIFYALNWISQRLLILASMQNGENGWKRLKMIENVYNNENDDER